MHFPFFSRVRTPLHRLMPAMALIAASSCMAQVSGAYKVTNIVSDGSVPAATTDASFINPWGISTSPNWWISTEGSGLNYVIPSSGAIAFKVTVPAASGVSTATGSPSGSATTAGATGMVLPNGTKASFLFSTLDGTISGWNGKLGTAGSVAQVVVNNTSAGAVYTGLAVLNTSTASYVLAPNFGAGRAVEVYDSTFKRTALAGTFTDPNLPSNYAPYAIHIIGTQIFVTYAVRTASTPYQEVLAPGNGIVDVFDPTGAFVARVAGGGNLNAPWGVAIAPAGFGIFGKDILIGNFGDGIINVYDPKTFAYLGQVADATGKTFVYPSLWELLPGGSTVTNSTSVSAGDTNTVYFTAGLAGEAHGLFAAISNDTSSGTPAFGLSAGDQMLNLSAGGSVQTTIAVAPTYNFSGSIALACQGLPAGASCAFSPAQLSVTGTSSATTILTIKTTRAYASVDKPGIFHSSTVLAALALPFTLLLSVRRFSNRLRLSIVAICVLTSAALVGCSTYGTTPTTPAGQSTVVVSASSGTTSKQTTVMLNVQ